MTVDFIEQDSAHIESFINGFESIIKQKSRNGFVDIGGCETYTTGVMLANGVKFQDTYDGFENFIAEGIKKLWEMVSSFFKGIWNFFFGSDKKLENAKKDAKEIPSQTNTIANRIAEVSKKLESSDALKEHYDRVAKINAHRKRISELLKKSTKYFSPDELGSNDFKSEVQQMAGSDIPQGIQDKIKRISQIQTRIGEKLKSSIGLKERIEAYQVPQGLRLDRSELDKLLQLVNEYAKDTTEQTDLIKETFTLSGEVIKDLESKLGGGDGVKTILRIFQATNKKIGLKLKFYVNTINAIKEELNKLDKMLSE